MGLCLCGSGQAFETCCEPILCGVKKARIPEALMRSRYVAFCLKNTAYLIYSAVHRPDPISLQSTFANTQWHSLRILKSDSDTVEFVAFFSENNKVRQLHEKSKFIRVDGEWKYQTGKLLDDITLGRNDFCWCGSGKKYKKCHGAAQN